MTTNKDQVDGRIKEAKGTIKEVTGQIIGDEKMEAKGAAEKIVGKAQAKFGDAKKDVKDALKGA